MYSEITAAFYISEIFLVHYILQEHSNFELEQRNLSQDYYKSAHCSLPLVIVNR